MPIGRHTTEAGLNKDAVPLSEGRAAKVKAMRFPNPP